VVTVAPNDRAGLEAQVDGAWTTPVTFRGIEVITFGSQGTGAAPQVTFTENSINAALTPGQTYNSTVLEAVRFTGPYGSGTGTFTNNSFTGWTTAVNNQVAATIPMSGNWWGTSSDSAIQAAITNSGGGVVDFSTFLATGTDSAPSTIGFQADLSSLVVSPLGAQTGSIGRVQEGVNLVAQGGTVNIAAGTYSDGVVTVNTANLTVNAAAGVSGFSFALGSANNLTLAGSGNVNITGNGNGNTLNGNSGANALSGNDGNDTLAGGGGNDTIDGGGGIDTADFSEKTTAVVLTLNGATNATASIGGVAEDTIVNIENITGGSAADTLTGDGLANTLLGNGGNDTLRGLGGNDTLDGGTGTDTADFSEKTTAVVLTLNGATNATASIGGVAEDTIVNIENITGGSAADTLTGDALNNNLLGNGGNDTLTGGGGNDYIRGGAGNDFLDGGTGTADLADFSDKTTAVVLTLNGATNATATVGGVAEDTIVNIENITGGSAADNLTGDALANTFRGLGGNDTLTGGDGNDSLTGGDGNDTFLFSIAPNSSTNRDTITDFISATDKLSFSRAVYSGFGSQTALTSGQFASGANLTTASNANQRFIYDTNSGILRFDSDGSGATASIEVAVLSSKPTIVFGDFSLIA
jgi:Ca2+-binding RTX toxin-like protein